MLSRRRDESALRVATIDALRGSSSNVGAMLVHIPFLRTCRDCASSSANEDPSK